MSSERNVLQRSQQASRPQRARLSLVAFLMALAFGAFVGHGNVAASGNFDSSLAYMLNAYNIQPTAEHQRVTYEAGEEEIYHQAPNGDRLSYTTETARLGSRAGTVLLLPDDDQYRGNLGYRAEWQSPFYADEGNEYAYAASYYLPEDWYQGTNPNTFNDRIIFQLHEGHGSPTFSLHIHAGDERFFVRHKLAERRFETLWSGDFETEEWYDFAFRARWSHSSDGFFQVYLNGQLVHQYTGQTLNDSDRLYTKWGIYGQPTKLLVDEVSIVEGPDGLFAATPATVATLMNEVPSSGVTLVRFSGGGNDDLVATSGCEDSAMFWFAGGGELVWFNPVAPDFVNQRWNQLFNDALPRNTLLIATCEG